jgi:putative metalloprotease
MNGKFKGIQWAGIVLAVWVVLVELLAAILPVRGADVWAAESGRNPVINRLFYLKGNTAPAKGVSLKMLQNAWDNLSGTLNFDAYLAYDDRDTVNAYLTLTEDRGNYLVVVYRGILELMRTEDEIAGILGHEIGHGVLRHLQDGANKQMGTALVGVILSELFGGGTLTDLIIGTGVSLAQSGYSREAEVEADDFGAEALALSGYSPWGLYNSIRRMAEANIVTPPSGFNSHPPTERRLTRMKEKAEYWEAQLGGAKGSAADSDPETDGEEEGIPASAGETTSDQSDVLDSYPIDAELHNSLAILHRTGWGFYSKGDYRAALDAFTRGWQSYDRNYLAALWAGRACLKLNRKRDALAWAERALAANPNYLPAKELRRAAGGR